MVDVKIPEEAPSLKVILHLEAGNDPPFMVRRKTGFSSTAARDQMHQMHKKTSLLLDSPEPYLTEILQVYPGVCIVSR